MTELIQRQNHKSRITSQHINKNKKANIADATSHLNSVQPMGRGVTDAANWTISEQCVRAVGAEEAQLITKPEQNTVADRHVDMVNISSFQ